MSDWKDSRLKTINFMYIFNKILLGFSVLVGFILMIKPEVGDYDINLTRHPYAWTGFWLIITGIINFFILKFIIQWAENTLYIRSTNEELVELMKKQLEYTTNMVNKDE